LGFIFFPMYFTSPLLLLVLIYLCNCCIGTDVSFDSRSFLFDGKRELLIGGSVHYPRSSAAEWPTILKEAQNNGINLIQTYIFWDIHEPEQGKYYFPIDEKDNEANFVEFLVQAHLLGLKVHLRLGPFVCAEWNYGGIPEWMRETGATFRTTDPKWTKPMFDFNTKVLQIVRDQKLLAADGGPIVMLQIENEFGNLEDDFVRPNAGEEYVAECANYALAQDVGGIPWVMCQQGEGTGTPPPAEIINACNGYYCDAWISAHAQDFPNQPHMFTENWPGWFQKWGEAVPHRPASDIAYSVARWFARGGSYMNYYMAFGGSSFGREVGGPAIIQSYDYDVQVNEYLLHNEPKFSLLSGLHTTLYEVADILFDDQPPPAVMISDECESHTYFSSKDSSCVLFVSNYGTNGQCKFNEDIIEPWSVSIYRGTESSSKSCSNNLQMLYGTKVGEPAKSLPSANVQTPIPLPANEFKLVDNFVQVYVESTPFQLLNSNSSYKYASSVELNKPSEQLFLTKDETDYLWYSFDVELEQSPSEIVSVEFEIGDGAGHVNYIYVNGERVGATLSSYTNQGGIERIRYDNIPFQKGANQLEVLFVAMGLRNYGKHLEKLHVALISNVIISTGRLSGPILHSVGLVGETLQISSSQTAPETGINVAGTSFSQPMGWYHLSFTLNEPLSDLSPPRSYALDLGPIGKGQVWLNGKMLGRYWNILASEDGGCEACSLDYVGPYNADGCRSGCGLPSQRYYKVPTQWVNMNGMNTIIFFDELGGQAPLEAIQLVNIEMTTAQ
jgi:beta-galactosidase